MRQRILQHWKSTLIGMIGAAAVAAYGVIQANGGVPDWKMIGSAAAVGAIGALARDFGGGQ